MSLLDDLETAARHAVNSAEQERRLGEPALAKEDEALADRLRAHAARLREEMRRLERIRDKPLAGEMWTEGGWNRLEALRILNDGHIVA